MKERIDDERMEELVDAMEQLRDFIHGGASGASSSKAGAADGLTKAYRRLEQTVSKLQVLPLAPVSQKTQKLAHELAHQLGKNIEVDLSVPDIDLPHGLRDALSDSLVHLVRNALDHGMEPADDRKKAGKNPIGRITVTCRLEGADLALQIRDDGRGPDYRAIGRQAVKRGMLKAEDKKVDSALLLSFLKRSGFSTRERADAVSGRGVGLDAVESTIRKLGGTLELRDTGSGFESTLRVPLVLVGMDAFVFRRKSGEPYCVAVEGLEACRAAGFDQEPEGEPHYFLFRRIDSSFPKYAGRLAARVLAPNEGQPGSGLQFAPLLDASTICSPDIFV